MLRTAVLSEFGVRELLGRICEKSRLLAPARRGKTSYDFQWIEDPADVQIGYSRTVLPPKQAFLPPREAVLNFSVDGATEAKPVLDEEPFVLFGIHACDLQGVNQLDWAMGQRHGVPDPHYLARRQAATIVGVECEPDEHCFCTSVGSADTRTGADLYLTPIDGGYVVEVLTEKGQELLRDAPDARDASADEQSAAAGVCEQRKQQQQLKINAPMQDLPDALDSQYASDAFEQTAARCYSCGTCTNVCPTCFCFDVDDDVDLLLQQGTRERKYDSCQFQDFALVAGGHNFRGQRTDRVRHRWFRKFVYLLREHGQPFCIGCGRCSSACTAGISLVDVMNSVLAEAREEVAR
jgi:sulfhydrogenase subunit beta (sulfur reductase)